VYLRAPTQDGLQRILHVSEMRGFPGMIGSIDCMHRKWKYCPKAWEGQFTRGIREPPQSFLKKLHLMIYGSDMLFL